MKKLLKFLIGLIVLLLIGYLIFMNLPKANIKNKDAVKSLTAAQLFKEFNANENQASTNYIGKVLEVNGTIQNKMLDNQEAPVVLLGNNKSNQVLITLEANQTDKLESYNKGDQIKIKAQCSGKLMEVVMNKGIIAE